MNRSRYIPFERNRYFYGKLLTVRDFMSEQTYYTDKRRLTNRLLFGSGVIAGLQVVAVDDKSISVETGAALDQMGREIIVPSPLTVKLSNLDGFTNNDYAKSVYLCLAYDEKGKEPVHTVAGSLGESEEVSEHNRILESYRLFIREQPPAPALLEYDYLIEDTSVWYDDGQVRVLQSVPRYVVPGQSFELRLTFEKTLQTPPITFQYEPELLNVEPVDELVQGKFVFSEPTDGGAARYTKTIKLRALPLDGKIEQQTANIAAKPGTVKLVIGDRMIYELSQLKQGIEVSEEPVQDRLLHAYYSRSLDRAIESPSEPCIYLARINLLQMGASYVIDHVETLPFNDQIINATFMQKLLAAGGEQPALIQQEERVAAVKEQHEAVVPLFPDIKQEFVGLLPDEEESEPEQLTATGVAEISIVPQGEKKWYQRRQRNFHSEEIAHGLEQGAPVLITVAISDEQEASDVPVPEMWKRSNAIYWGSQDVFAGSEHALDYPKLSIGVIQYPSKGTFRIGVRVHKKTERMRVRIRWWAVKAIAQGEAEGQAAEQIGLGVASAAAAKG